MTNTENERFIRSKHGMKKCDWVWNSFPHFIGYWKNKICFWTKNVSCCKFLKSTWKGLIFLLFLTALLRCNWHSSNRTYLSCILWYVWNIPTPVKLWAIWISPQSLLPSPGNLSFLLLGTHPSLANTHMLSVTYRSLCIFLKQVWANYMTCEQQAACFYKVLLVHRHSCSFIYALSMAAFAVWQGNIYYQGILKEKFNPYTRALYK